MPEPVDPDPMRAFTAIGEAGLAAAASVVEQVLALSRRSSELVRLPFPTLAPPAPSAGGPTDGEPPTGPTPADARRLRADAERLIELYGEWTRVLLDAAVTMVEQTSAATGPPAADGLVVGPVGPGATASASVFLHTLDGPAAGTTTLFVTTFTASDGSTIAPSAVDLDPADLDTVASRTSHEVTVTVTVPASCGAGTFRGHLLAKGLDEVALPVVVVVAER